MNHQSNQPDRLYTLTFLMMTFMNFLLLTGDGLYVLFPLQLESFGFRETQVGLVMSFYFVSGMIARFLGGPLIDQLGRRYCARMGILISMLCLILYFLPETILLPHNIYGIIYFIILRALHGLGHGIYFTSVFTWAADYAPKGRMAESIGVFGISGLLTISSGSFLGEWILKLYNNDFVYIFLAHFILALTGYILSRFMKDVHSGTDRTVKQGIAVHIKKPPFLRASLAAALFGMGMSGVFTFMAPYTRFIGIGDVSYFFTAYAASAVIFRLLSRKFGDRLDRRATLVPGFLLQATGLSFVYMANTQGSIMILGIILGCAHGILFPPLSTLMLDAVGQESRGTGTGLFNASMDIGNMSGAYMAGAMADFWGFGAMYCALGMLIILGLIIFYLTAGPDGNRSLPDMSRQEGVQST